MRNDWERIADELIFNGSCNVSAFGYVCNMTTFAVSTQHLQQPMSNSKLICVYTNYSLAPGPHAQEEIQQSSSLFFLLVFLGALSLLVAYDLLHGKPS